MPVIDDSKKLEVYKKCRIENKLIYPCKTLMSQMNPFDARGKGLNWLQLMNIETSQRTRDFIFYKDKTTSKGVCINFCPWCGEKIMVDNE